MSTHSIPQHPRAILLMGIPASGKSTFCRLHFAEPAFVRINLDTLKTRHRESLLLAECIQKRLSLVVDNTNTLPQERARYIHSASQAAHRVEGFDALYFVARTESGFSPSDWTE